MKILIILLQPHIGNSLDDDWVMELEDIVEGDGFWFKGARYGWDWGKFERKKKVGIWEEEEDWKFGF
jgi:hypothetical protein